MGAWRTIKNSPPSWEDWEEWACDNNLYVSEQDEDLLIMTYLSDDDFIKLAGLPGCCKGSYMEGMMISNFYQSVRRGPHCSFEAQQARLSEARASGLSGWADAVEETVNLLQSREPADRKRAKVIGEAAFRGARRPREVTVTERVSETHWEILLRELNTVTDYLYVHKADGRLLFRRGEPAEEEALRVHSEGSGGSLT